MSHPVPTLRPLIKLGRVVMHNALLPWWWTWILVLMFRACPAHAQDAEIMPHPRTRAAGVWIPEADADRFRALILAEPLHMRRIAELHRAVSISQLAVTRLRRDNGEMALVIEGLRDEVAAASSWVRSPLLWTLVGGGAAFLITWGVLSAAD